MGRIQFWIVLLLMISLIHQSFCAVPYQFVRNRYRNRDRNADYKRSKTANSYRGILLSYSPEKKDEMCNNLFPPPKSSTAQEPTISNAPSTGLAPSREQHPLFKSTVVKIGESQANEDSLFFTCVGHRKLPNGSKESSMLSTAFLPGFMYAGFQAKGEMYDKRSVEILGYISMSPEYVEMDQDKLEAQYAGIRLTLRNLEKESPDYIKQIHAQYDLLKLSKWQLNLLCESIVATPVYQRAGVEFVSDSTYLARKLMTFEHEVNIKEIAFDCVICKIERKILGSKLATNLYVTQSYDHNWSIYVLKLRRGGIYFDKYFINVPVLMNVHDSVIEEVTQDDSDEDD